MCIPLLSFGGNINSLPLRYLWSFLPNHWASNILSCISKNKWHIEVNKNKKQTCVNFSLTESLAHLDKEKSSLEDPRKSCRSGRFFFTLQHQESSVRYETCNPIKAMFIQTEVYWMWWIVCYSYVEKINNQDRGQAWSEFLLEQAGVGLKKWNLVYASSVIQYVNVHIIAAVHPLRSASQEFCFHVFLCLFWF